MTTDPARSILDEFESARKMAIARFCRSYGKYLRSDDAICLANERILIYAGLLATNHPSGRDADAGKLDEWREKYPDNALTALVVRKLLDDLFDAVFRSTRELGRPDRRGISLTMALETMEENVNPHELSPTVRRLVEALKVPDATPEWDPFWEKRYPYLTMIYRDGMERQEIRKKFRKGNSTLVREVRAEMAALRRELGAA